jgi:hypothetical protein
VDIGMTDKIPYTFHRQDGFYILEFDDDKEAILNGLCNPGTLKIVNEITREVIFNSEHVTVH